jgi:hypothetical protein
VAEAEYIESSKPCSQSKDEKSAPPPLPWKAIFTSVPFLTLCFAHFANNAGWLVPSPRINPWVVSVLVREICLIFTRYIVASFFLYNFLKGQSREKVCGEICLIFIL